MYSGIRVQSRGIGNGEKVVLVGMVMGLAVTLSKKWDAF